MAADDNSEPEAREGDDKDLTQLEKENPSDRLEPEEFVTEGTGE